MPVLLQFRLELYKGPIEDITDETAELLRRFVSFMHCPPQMQEIARIFVARSQKIQRPIGYGWMLDGYIYIYLDDIDGYGMMYGHVGHRD